MTGRNFLPAQLQLLSIVSRIAGIMIVDCRDEYARARAFQGFTGRLYNGHTRLVECNANVWDHSECTRLQELSRGDPILIA